LLLALVFCFLLSTNAHARCDFIYGTGWSSVIFTPPATIPLPVNLQPGTQTVLWTSGSITPSTIAHMSCSSTTDSGIRNFVSATPQSGTLFPVGYIPNLYFQILHPDPMPVYPGFPIASTPDSQFSVPSQLQLVAMGPIPNGSQLAAHQLANWMIDTQYGAQPVEIFSTNASTTFVGPACSVAVDPTLVVLPTVSSTEFTGRGSTTGMTRFDIQLTCRSGSRLAITLETNREQSNATGVIRPANGGGYAKRVGVQILDKDSHPINFGSTIDVTGSTPDGTYSIPFFARYYQTSNTGVTPGQVTATATYTLSYP
jgi:type 1 fimbria pilin